MRGHGATVGARNIRHAVFIVGLLRGERPAADAGHGHGRCQVPHGRRGRQGRRAHRPYRSTGPGRTGVAAPGARCGGGSARTRSAGFAGARWAVVVVGEDRHGRSAAQRAAGDHGRQGDDHHAVGGSPRMLQQAPRP